MGQVYRARDTRLKRDVALKFLPDSFAADADRLARFQREAEVLASLSHLNIAGIYGLEESAGVRALVMELVEGETLADRIARGPIRFEEALPIARQICEALEAAHEQGIIHRDLKPANIKVTPNGQAKVLDFGLAKLNEPNGRNTPDAPHALSMSPTMTSPAMTGVGVLLGTAAYMSPEQAAGKSVDKRADLWAFGVVLFEMLTGRQVFAGETVSHVVASVLKDEPDWRALPSNTPGAIGRLLRRCLEKDSRQRLDSAASARLEIDDALTNRAETGPGTAPVGIVALWSRRRAMPWVIAAAASAGLAIVLGSWAPWRTAPVPPSQQLRVELGVDASLSTDQGAAAVLSPDGNTLAFTARRPGVADSDPDLYTRRLDQLEATLLPGTEGAHNPFFSPDGQWIAFFAAGKLKKILVTGGAVVTLCDAPNGRGGWWADDGTIVFTPNNTPQARLLRVSSAGGTPQALTMLASAEVTQRWPQVLPSGRAVLYSSSATTNTWESANIVVQHCPRVSGKSFWRRVTTPGICLVATLCTSTKGHCSLRRSI
jgi:protein kinase-like protein/WD40 repeat protein